jgi:hypothetical protein
VVKIVTYVTDIRNLPEAGKCRTEALDGAPQPVVEVDVIAITKEP